MKICLIILTVCGFRGLYVGHGFILSYFLYIWCEVGVQPHFFWKSVVPASVKRLFFPPLNGLSTLMKNQLTISQFNRLTIDIWIYFWMIQFYSIGLYVYPYACTSLFDYCNFVISFEWETREGKQKRPVLNMLGRAVTLRDWLTEMIQKGQNLSFGIRWTWFKSQLHLFTSCANGAQ